MDLPPHPLTPHQLHRKLPDQPFSQVSFQAVRRAPNPPPAPRRRPVLHAPLRPPPTPTFVTPMQAPFPASQTTELHAAFLQARDHPRPGRALLVHPPPLPQALFRLVGRRPGVSTASASPRSSASCSPATGSGSTGTRSSPAGPRSRYSTPPWSSPEASAGAAGTSRWRSSRPSGPTSPSTGSTTSSGPPAPRCCSSVSPPSGPAGSSSSTGAGSSPAARRCWRPRSSLWGVHHLDYPFLRARGAWNPWGYYLDILLTLAVGTGILLLVLDDLRRGLGALSDISGDLQQVGREQDVLDALLARPLTLPAVRGSALFLVEDGVARFARGAGVYRGGPDPASRGRRRPARPRARHRSAPSHRRMDQPRCRRHGLSLRGGTPAASERRGDRRAGPGRRRPRSVHRARRPVPGRPRPAGRRGAGERRSLPPAGDPHRRAGSSLRSHDRAARGGAAPALPRAARRDRPGVLRGQDRARRRCATASRRDRRRGSTRCST